MTMSDSDDASFHSDAESDGSFRGSDVCTTIILIFYYSEFLPSPHLVLLETFGPMYKVAYSATALLTLHFQIASTFEPLDAQASYYTHCVFRLGEFYKRGIWVQLSILPYLL